MRKTLLNKPRWRNYVLWLAVFSLFIPQLLTTCHIQIPYEWDKLVDIGLTVLVLAGIISNPLTKGFLDNEENAQ